MSLKQKALLAGLAVLALATSARVAGFVSPTCVIWRGTFTPDSSTGAFLNIVETRIVHDGGMLGRFRCRGPGCLSKRGRADIDEDCCGAGIELDFRDRPRTSCICVTPKRVGKSLRGKCTCFHSVDPAPRYPVSHGDLDISFIRRCHR